MHEIDALEAQCRDLAALVGELGDADWDRPSRCDGWTVKELVAHCEGMLERLPGYAEMKVDGPAEIDRVGYYRYDPNGPRDGEDPSKTFSDVIRDRVVEEAAGRTNDEIKASLEQLARESLIRAREVDPKLVMKRSGHPPIEFGEFVASRVLEFGVHAMDIGHAALKGERIHPDAVPVVTGILDGLLQAELPKGMGWDARTYILTGTGRRRLEPNERFVLGPLAQKFPLLA